MDVNTIIKNKPEIGRTNFKVGNETCTVPKAIPSFEVYTIARVAVESTFEIEDGAYDPAYSQILAEVLIVNQFFGLGIDDDMLGGEPLFDLYDAFVGLGMITHIQTHSKASWDSVMNQKALLENTLQAQQRSFGFLVKGMDLGQLAISKDVLSDIQSPDFKDTMDEMKETIEAIG